MSEITISTGHPDAGRIYAEALDRVTAERDAALGREAALIDQLDAALRQVKANWDYAQDKQQRLTAADERADVLESVSVKQAALLDELGIPLDEVDDLFGETLKNSKRYEYLRSVMAVENFPAPHPAWSEPSEVESKRIDDLCDAALKPAEPPLPEGWYGVDCEENNREPGITVRFGSGTEISSYGKCSRYLPYKMVTEIRTELKPAEPAKCNACGGRDSVCVDWDFGAWSDCQECTKP